jgi:hypothetical protein
MQEAANRPIWSTGRWFCFDHSLCAAAKLKSSLCLGYRQGSNNFLAPHEHSALIYMLSIHWNRSTNADPWRGTRPTSSGARGSQACPSAVSAQSTMAAASPVTPWCGPARWPVSATAAAPCARRGACRAEHEERWRTPTTARSACSWRRTATAAPPSSTPVPHGGTRST